MTGGGAGAGLALDVVRGQFALTRDELWILYIALGGILNADAIAAYLSGFGHIGATEHNTIVQALNEISIDAGQDHPVAYIDTPGKR